MTSVGNEDQSNLRDVQSPVKKEIVCHISRISVKIVEVSNRSVSKIF